MRVSFVTQQDFGYDYNNLSQTKILRTINKTQVYIFRQFLQIFFCLFQIWTSAVFLYLSVTPVLNVLTLWAHLNASVQPDLQEDSPSALVRYLHQNTLYGSWLDVSFEVGP